MFKFVTAAGVKLKRCCYDPKNWVFQENSAQNTI